MDWGLLTAAPGGKPKLEKEHINNVLVSECRGKHDLHAPPNTVLVGQLSSQSPSGEAVM